eukprot:jgi/Tetstr1/462414/TSEL_007420.t1
MASVSTFHAAAGTDDASWEDIMLPRGAREPPHVPRGPPLRYYLTTSGIDQNGAPVQDLSTGYSPLPRSLDELMFPDGWLDKDGKVHRRHTADARILQRDLDDVFQIYDLLAPAEEPLRDLVEDGTDLPASSPASSAELFKTITAALALCTTVALRINKRGKKLHVEHEYGAEVAKEFDAVDPLGGKGSADYKELKKAIEKVKAKKPSSSSSREKPSSSSREPESFHRGSDDRREGGRREEKSPAVVSATSHQLAGDAFV